MCRQRCGRKHCKRTLCMNVNVSEHHIRQDEAEIDREKRHGTANLFRGTSVKKEPSRSFYYGDWEFAKKWRAGLEGEVVHDVGGQ